MPLDLSEMSCKGLPLVRSFSAFLCWFLAPCFLCGCLPARGIDEIVTFPAPLIYEDDSTARFGDQQDNVFIEVLFLEKQVFFIS